MRRKFILTIAVLFSILSSNFFQPNTISSQSAYLMLEDFQKYNDNPFSEWNFKGDPKKASAIYSVIDENGRKFLRGSTLSVNSMIQLGKQVNQNNLIGKNKISWDIYVYPCISWDWRVRTLPLNGNEKYGNTNDSAASIYVVFQRARIPFAGWQKQPANWIKYVWSSTLPVGTVVSKKFSKFGMSLYEGRYVVVASGSKDLGKWITFKRNVLSDYRTYFGENPAFHPSVVGILTDSNSTGSKAEADYDNIKALSE